MMLDCFPVREHTRDSSQDNVGGKCMKRFSNSKIDWLLSAHRLMFNLFKHIFYSNVLMGFLYESKNLKTSIHSGFIFSNSHLSLPPAWLLLHLLFSLLYCFSLCFPWHSPLSDSVYSVLVLSILMLRDEHTGSALLIQTSFYNLWATKYSSALALRFNFLHVRCYCVCVFKARGWLLNTISASNGLTVWVFMGRIVPVLHPMHKTVTAVIAHAYDDSQHTS